MPRVTEREPSATKLPDEFDPFAQATIESPYAFYRSLRTHAPVYRVPKADYYLVSRHADVKSVVMNPGTYSSNLTSIVMAQTDGSMASLDVGQLGIGPVDVLAVQDPPAHTRQRALTHPRFAMRTVRGREQSVRAQACELLDAALESREETNWMKKFASLLPMAVIIDIIGLPLEDRDQLKAWSDLAIALLSGTSTTEQMATHAMGALSLFQYLQARFEEARQRPQGRSTRASGGGDRCWRRFAHGRGKREHSSSDDHRGERIDGEPHRKRDALASRKTGAAGSPPTRSLAHTPFRRGSGPPRITVSRALPKDERGLRAGRRIASGGSPADGLVGVGQSR